MEHYLSANTYLRRKYGCKVYKLALDGGFTCPTRDGTLDTRGCIFCSGRGSGDFAEKAYIDMDRAITDAIARVRSKTSDGRFIAYFQNYTSTYAPADYLRTIYSAAISREDIVGISIGTRPDCIPDDVVMLLSGMNRIKPVTVELGLQTIHAPTAEYIRRHYDLEVFDDAVRRLKAEGIEVVVHMIIGLPGETPEMMVQTARYIGQSGADGVKFQLLHVLKGTDLAADYEKGLFEVLSLEEYIRILEECIMAIPPEMVVHRITGDGAKKDLIAPLWSADKKNVLNRINRAFDEDCVVQGLRIPKTNKDCN